MKTTIEIRSSSIGVYRSLEVEDWDNDRIGISATPQEGTVLIGFEDLPKLIAVLEAFAKVCPAGEERG